MYVVYFPTENRYIGVGKWWRGVKTDLAHARVFKRKCDATNSVLQTYYRNTPVFEVREVTLTLTEGFA